MRRMTYFVMALAMVLGFTQCKKEQTPANNETEGVFITLNVNGGASTGSAAGGSRVIVTPGYTNPTTEQTYAKVDYENGDVIYVGYKNSYVGQLTYNGGSFSGTIDATPDMENKEPLHFYFLGGKGFNATVNETDNTATVNISSQAVKLPVISYAPSNDDYTGAGTYSAKLMNKCSIMKFNVTKPTEATESISAVCITGMKNKVTLNFNPNTTGTDDGFTYLKDGIGQIMMKGGTGESIETWAIVLPQAALAKGTAGSAYINDYEGTRPAIGVIGSNQYISDATGRTIAIDSENPTGMLIGEFTISSTQKAHFSKGNLQWTSQWNSLSSHSYIDNNNVTQTNGSGIYRFAEHQWDFVGDGGTTAGNVSGGNNNSISQSCTDWIDLFGWGTGINPYQSIRDDDYYKTWNDWSKHAIYNGGNAAGTWHTMDQSEFFAVGAADKCGMATVNGVKGVILIPDNFVDPMKNKGSNAFVYYNVENEYTSNDYNSDGWKEMEAVGVVFLPAAGSRIGTNFYFTNKNGYGICQYYAWKVDNQNNIVSSRVYFKISYYTNDYIGYPVRLVKVIE